MQIELKRKNDAFHFEAVGTAGVAVQIDSSPDHGGENKGARPMALILMGLAGCSAIDVISILKKQRQKIERFSVTASGERRRESVPAVFTKIHLHFSLSGEVDEIKLRKAIELSMEKYCSVTAMLQNTVDITHTSEVL